MSGFYVLIFVLGLYFISLGLTLMFSKKAAVVQRSQTEEIIVNGNTSSTFNEIQTSRPSYKKNNLRIEIPSPEAEAEDSDTKFVKTYYKVINRQEQCFPLLLFTRGLKNFTIPSRLTLWFSLFSLEIFLNSIIMNYEPLGASSIVSCIISSPLTMIVSPIFSCSVNFN